MFLYFSFLFNFKKNLSAIQLTIIPKILLVTSAMDNPIIPYIEPNTKIPIIWTSNVVKVVTNIILFFSCAQNFGKKYVDCMVIGIIAQLIIWMTISASTNSGKICETIMPIYTEISEEHFVACHHYKELKLLPAKKK